MNAETILASRPSQLFRGAESDIKKKFRELASQWHPDHCRLPQAEDVFQHILRCRDAALRGEEGLHRVVFERLVSRGDQKPKFALDYVRSFATENGVVYISYDNVSYLITDDKLGLVDPVTRRKWAFPDKKMEVEMTKYLPRSNRVEQTKDGPLLVYKRNSDQILLVDLLAWHKQTGKTMDARHVMWIISSLLNTLCYLEVQKTAHCAILPHYLLVSPDLHTVALTGPVLYATPFGTRPKAVPHKVLALHPRLKAPEAVVENSRLDLLCLRSLTMECLGLTNPALLARDTALHKGLKDWMLSKAPDSAVKDYVAWEKLRGKRAFTAYETTASEMYVALTA